MEKWNLLKKTSEEVEVPKLAENGQNWKIYHTKIIEAAATDITDPLGVLAGWQPDDGSYNWECLDAILKWTFYTSVPITILRPIWKLDTTHEIFNYLAKHFCDNNPIVDPHAKKSEPSANKVDGAGTAAEDISADLEKRKGSPTSESAAAETLASANRDKEDLSTTKDLTRGTEDPHVSLETLAEDSAESADGTLVLLTGTPRKTQTEPQNSLPLTPRLPIEGEPNGCKQEAVNSIVMAGCTNGMVKRAEPTVVDADVDRMALLGGELAERASGVDEGDGMECEPQTRLQQIKLLCKEDDQHSRNAHGDIPSANGLPLEGQWTVYPSGKMRDPKGRANVLNAMPECVHSSSESKVTEDTKGVESEGCREGASKWESVDEVDGSAGRGTGPADTSNELMEFVVLLIEPEDLGSGEILHVYLGGMWMHADDMDGPGRGMDVSKGLLDGMGAQMDASNASNKPEMAVVSHSEGAGTYLGARDAKHIIEVMDGVGSHTDTLSGCGNVLSVETHTIKPENEMANVSIP